MKAPAWLSLSLVMHLEVDPAAAVGVEALEERLDLRLAEPEAESRHRLAKVVQIHHLYARKRKGAHAAAGKEREMFSCFRRCIPTLVSSHSFGHHISASRKSFRSTTWVHPGGTRKKGRGGVLCFSLDINTCGVLFRFHHFVSAVCVTTRYRIHHLDARAARMGGALFFFRYFIDVSAHGFFISAGKTLKKKKKKRHSDPARSK